MDKDFAVGVRDKLNEMAEELLDENVVDIQREVAACCIAMAVESLEEWIYNGNMMPSVIPVKPKREWFRMPDGQKDDDIWEGPPWDRKKKPVPTIEDKLPTLKKLKKQKEMMKNSPKEEEIDLDSRTLADWTSYEKSMLEKGDRSGLIRAVVSQTRCSVKKARAYIDMLETQGVIERV